MGSRQSRTAGPGSAAPGTFTYSNMPARPVNQHSPAPFSSGFSAGHSNPQTQQTQPRSTQASQGDHVTMESANAVTVDAALHKDSIALSVVDGGAAYALDFTVNAKAPCTASVLIGVVEHVTDVGLSFTPHDPTVKREWRLPDTPCPVGDTKFSALTGTDARFHVPAAQFAPVGPVPLKYNPNAELDLYPIVICLAWQTAQGMTARHVSYLNVKTGGTSGVSVQCVRQRFEINGGVYELNTDVSWCGG